MRYIELHSLPAPFVAGGFTMFVWGVYTNPSIEPVPEFKPGFGLALPLADGADAPALHARYNPDTGEWASALADDAVPEYKPYHTAFWNNETWIIDRVEEP